MDSAVGQGSYRSLWVGGLSRGGYVVALLNAGKISLAMDINASFVTETMQA